MQSNITQFNSWTENFSWKKGLASALAIECSLFDYNNEFYTSKRNSNAFEVNVRSAYSMRTCGRGYVGLEKFTQHLWTCQDQWHKTIMTKL